MVARNGTKNGAAPLHLAKSLRKDLPGPLERPAPAPELEELEEPEAPRDYHSHPKLSNHAAREIAVKAMCDPRAVFKYLHGGKQTAMMRARIEAAMSACGAQHLVGWPAIAASVRAANAKQS